MINQAFNCSFINLSTSSTVEEIGKNAFNKIVKYLKLIWQVNKQLLIFRPDLCYLTPTSHGVGFYKDTLIIFIVKLFGVKVIYHFHNKGISNKQDRFIDNLLYRTVFRNSHLILLSNRLYPDVQKYVKETAVHYCPCGIPEKTLQSKIRQGPCEDGISKSSDPVYVHEEASNGTCEILFLSHLVESKGVFVLIQALQIIKSRGHAFHCIIIGGESDITELNLKNKIAELGLTDYLVVAGNKYGEEKQKAFKKADIFVHPTFNDCMPLVIIEAMQYSIPVVSTIEGAIPDLVEDGVNGFLVPQKDAKELANKLEVLIRNPELRTRMGANSRAKYEREFTLDRFEKRMVEIIEKVESSK